MNVLVFNGSPRRNGHTVQLAARLVEGAAAAGHECRTVNLRELDLRDCTSCLACQEKGACVLRDDDIGAVESAVAWADVIVLATPTHWGNLSSLMLRMFERLFGFLLREQRRGMPVALAARGKRVVLITACSTPWPWNWVFNQSRATFGRLREICRYSGMKVVGTLVLPGTILRTEIPRRCLRKAEALGRGL